MKNQLRNIEEVSVLLLKKLCEDLGVKFDEKHPKDVINKIIRSLSTNSEQHHLLVFDEVYACDKDRQTSADWSDLATAENVTWVLAIRPYSSSTDMKVPPSYQENCCTVTGTLTRSGQSVVDYFLFLINEILQRVQKLPPVSLSPSSLE